MDNSEQILKKNSYEEPNKIVLDLQSNSNDILINSTQQDTNKDLKYGNSYKATENEKKIVKINLEKSQLPYEEIE